VLSFPRILSMKLKKIDENSEDSEQAI